MPGGRVLIVDDEVGQSEILSFYLKDLPVEVRVAEGSAVACQWLSQEPFHAVLCDLVMPGGVPGGSCASCGAGGSPPRTKVMATRFVCERTVIGGMAATEVGLKSGQLDGAVNDDHC